MLELVYQWVDVPDTTVDLSREVLGTPKTESKLAFGRFEIDGQPLQIEREDFSATVFDSDGNDLADWGIDSQGEYMNVTHLVAHADNIRLTNGADTNEDGDYIWNLCREERSAAEECSIYWLQRPSMWNLCICVERRHQLMTNQFETTYGIDLGGGRCVAEHICSLEQPCEDELE